MLGALSPTASDNHPNYQWRPDIAAVHIAPFSSLIDNLLEGDQGKIDPLVSEYGPHAVYCRAENDAGERVFRDRHIQHSSSAKFFNKSCRRSEDAFGIGRTQSDEINGGIVRECNIERFVDCVRVCQRPVRQYSIFSSSVDLLERLIGSREGSGLRFGKSVVNNCGEFLFNCISKHLPQSTNF